MLHATRGRRHRQARMINFIGLKQTKFRWSAASGVYIYQPKLVQQIKYHLNRKNGIYEIILNKL